MGSNVALGSEVRATMQSSIDIPALEDAGNGLKIVLWNRESLGNRKFVLLATRHSSWRIGSFIPDGQEEGGSIEERISGIQRAIARSSKHRY